jgi:hypothetical protein
MAHTVGDKESRPCVAAATISEHPISDCIVVVCAATDRHKVSFPLDEFAMEQGGFAASGSVVAGYDRRTDAGRKFFAR